MFVVLHVADFALQAVLRTELHGTHFPAALFSGTGKKSVVLAANPAARELGVECGMSAPQAVARCPGLVIRSPHATAEAEARAALLSVGFTLSPHLEDTFPGVCTADIGGLDSTRIEPTACAALAALAQFGLAATAGVARTPLLALYAARSCRPEGSAAALANPSSSARAASHSLGAMGAGKSDFHSPTHVFRPSPAAATPPPHAFSSRLANPQSALRNPPLSRSALRLVALADEPRFLAPLPLSAADPSPELAAVLQGWGLRTLGDLISLPRDEIVRRFGTEGLLLWTRASGGAPRPLRPVTPAPRFSAQMELEHEVETLEPLLFILRRFLDRLTLELTSSQHVAAEIELTLRLEDETRHTRSFRLPEPTADVEILFRTLHTHLESLSTAASIVGVELRLTPARPLVRQQGLFETGLRDPHGFAETLARVGALVGSENVGTPQLEDTHRPDAVKLIAPLPVIPPPAEPPLHPPLGAPLRRFRPPLPARLEFIAEHPTYLWTEHVRGEIAMLSDPWPSSGEWWQADRAWSRLEWDVTMADGGSYRLLQVGESYFLEGEYD